MRRTVRILSAILITLLLVGCVFVLFWLMDTQDSRKVSPVLISTTATSMVSSSAPLFPKDIPLYGGISWGAPATTSETIGTTTIDGVQVISAVDRGITDISGKTQPIEDYYHAELLSMGWQQDESLDADGAGSSERTYVKGSRFLVISYESVPVDGNQQGPFTCPCNMHFSLFAGIFPTL